MMQRNKAFLICYCDIINNIISFKGRVLSDFKLGDILIYVIKNNNKEIYREYIVEKIIAYRKEIDFICKGTTCELICSGDILDFKEDDLLHLK